MTTTVSEYYGHRNVTGYASKHGTDNTMPLPDWLVGCELEIEGFNPHLDRRFGGITFTDDGSLRAREGGIGIEAITLPVATKFVPALLTAFYEKFQIGEKNYTERCSTHVHFNALPLSFDQVSTICLLYQTVEDLLFKYVSHDRDQSIFCVPWNQSNLSYSIVNRLSKNNESTHDVFRRWQKYSALNLIPLTTQGTMEFRHLHGTCDVKVITTWIALISKMFEYAMGVDLEKAKYQIVNMNTVSNYHEWLNMVFGKWADALRCDGFEAVLSQGVINSKLMLNKIDEPEQVKWTPERRAEGQVERLQRETAAHRASNTLTNIWNREPPPPPRAPEPVAVAQQLRDAAARGARRADPRPRATNEWTNAQIAMAEMQTQADAAAVQPFPWRAVGAAFAGTGGTVPPGTYRMIDTGVLAPIDDELDF